MIFTLNEMFDAIVMSLVLGYIFKSAFDIKKANQDGVPIRLNLSMKPFWMSFAVIAPAILLHELAHKFTAMGFGLDATFSASYFGLAIGLFLKLIHSPILFFIPAYVSIPLTALPIQSALIALVGPLTNGLLWLISTIILKSSKNLTTTQKVILVITKRINGILFIFNLIPLPGFDGFHFYSGIYQTFF